MEGNTSFRGDTFFRTYECEYCNSDYIFQIGDILKVAFCKYGKKYLEKEIKVEEIKSKIEVTFSSEEMNRLDVGKYVLEAELTTNNFTVTKQEKVEILEDNIRGGNNAEVESI